MDAIDETHKLKFDQNCDRSQPSTKLVQQSTLSSPLPAIYFQPSTHAAVQTQSSTQMPTPSRLSSRPHLPASCPSNCSHTAVRRPLPVVHQAIDPPLPSCIPTSRQLQAAHAPIPSLPLSAAHPLTQSSTHSPSRPLPSIDPAIHAQPYKQLSTSSHPLNHSLQSVLFTELSLPVFHPAFHSAYPAVAYLAICSLPAVHS